MFLNDCIGGWWAFLSLLRIRSWGRNLPLLWHGSVFRLFWQKLGSLSLRLLIPDHRWWYCARLELILPLVAQIRSLWMLDSATSVVDLLKDIGELGCPIYVERGTIGSQCLVLCIMFLKKVLLRKSQDLRLVGLSTGCLLLLRMRHKSLIIITLKIVVKIWILLLLEAWPDISVGAVLISSPLGRRVNRGASDRAIVKAKLIVWYLTLPGRFLLSFLAIRVPKMHCLVSDLIGSRCWTLFKLALLAFSAIQNCISRISLLRRLV